MSSTSITINGIEDLDASEIIRNPATGTKVAWLLLCDMLYRIQLFNKSPLLLQLSQRPSGEVDAVIPNTPKAENMAERINVQVATWYHYYWRDTNKGGEKFFKKLAERAFNAHLIHEISECVWDAKDQVVMSPRSVSEMSAVYEFESLDWVKNIVQADHNLKKKHVDPTAAFNFEKDFSVGTIHGKNDRVQARTISKDASEVIEVNDDNEVSLLSSKTQDGLAAPVVQEQGSSALAARNRVASSSTPPVIGLTTNATPAGATETVPVAAEGSSIPPSTGPDSSVDGRPVGE